LVEDGRLQATVRTTDGDLQSVVSEELLPLATRCQLVLTADGRQLQIHVDGQVAASTTCAMQATCDSDTVWFGTAADAAGPWDGRIGEPVMFDRALNGEEISALYQAALEEMAR
jgi:hypothetical protein